MARCSMVGGLGPLATGRRFCSRWCDGSTLDEYVSLMSKGWETESLTLGSLGLTIVDGWKMKYCKMLSDLWSLWCPNDLCHSNERCLVVRAAWGSFEAWGTSYNGLSWKQAILGSDLTINAMPVGYGYQSWDPLFSRRKSNLGHLQCGSGGCRSCKSLGGATVLIWVDSWLLECLVHLDLAISTWCKCCELNLNKWVSYRSEKKQILTWSLVFNAWKSQTLASILAASFIVATFQLGLPIFDVGGAEWRTCHVDLPLNVHYKMVRLDSACVHSGVFVRLNMLSIFFQVNGRSLLGRSLHDARGDHESSGGNAWCLVFVESWS